MLNLTNQPDKNCIIAKNSCKEICFVEPDLIESQGSYPVVIAVWAQGDLGAAGIFLGRDVEIGTTNGAGVFDGTIEGFKIMISVCFPNLVGASYTTLQDGAFRAVYIQFPDIKAYDNFLFESDNPSAGQIGFPSAQGIPPTLRDCYFDVRIYDENDNLLDKLESQYPNFSDTTPVLVEENCISAWNVGLGTTFPPPLDVVSIDGNFCKKIKYRIWLKCANETGCGFKAEQLVESDLFAVVNSVHDKDYDFGQHCVYHRLQDQILAKFLTQRDKVVICEGIDAWLWICPNIQILDDLNQSYEYRARYSGYDADGVPFGSASTFLGQGNNSFVIPTGWNYLESLTIPFPPTLSYYTVELTVTTNAGVIVLTRPVTYKIGECCCETALYFQEQLGSVTHICFEHCQKKIIDAQGETVCIGDKCDKEILTIGNRASLSYELKTKISDENLREMFIKSTRFWIKEDGEYKRVSIEKRKIRLTDKDGGTYSIELIVKFLDYELNE